MAHDSARHGVHEPTATYDEDPNFTAYLENLLLRFHNFREWLLILLFSFVATFVRRQNSAGWIAYLNEVNAILAGIQHIGYLLLESSSAEIVQGISRE